MTTTMNTVNAWINTIHAIDLLLMMGETFNGFTERQYKQIVKVCPLDKLRKNKVVVIAWQETSEKVVSSTDGYYLFDDGKTFTWKSDAKDYFFEHPNQSFKYVETDKRVIEIHKNFFNTDFEQARAVRAQLIKNVEEYKAERIGVLQAEVQELNKKIAEISCIRY